MALYAFASVIALNLATIMAFRADKRAAVAGGRRVRESTLLWLAFLGGSPAAYWSRRRFRHKTRKQPFGDRLDRVVMVQVGVLVGVATLWL